MSSHSLNSVTCCSYLHLHKRGHVEVRTQGPAAHHDTRLDMVVPVHPVVSYPLQSTIKREARAWNVVVRSGVTPVATRSRAWWYDIKMTVSKYGRKLIGTEVPPPRSLFQFIFGIQLIIFSKFTVQFWLVSILIHFVNLGFVYVSIHP